MRISNSFMIFLKIPPSLPHKLLISINFSNLQSFNPTPPPISPSKLYFPKSPLTFEWAHLLTLSQPAHLFKRWQIFALYLKFCILGGRGWGSRSTYNYPSPRKRIGLLLGFQFYQKYVFWSTHKIFDFKIIFLFKAHKSRLNALTKK